MCCPSAAPVSGHDFMRLVAFGRRSGARRFLRGSSASTMLPPRSGRRCVKRQTARTAPPGTFALCSRAAATVSGWGGSKSRRTGRLAAPMRSARSGYIATYSARPGGRSGTVEPLPPRLAPVRRRASTRRASSGRREAAGSGHFSAGMHRAAWVARFSGEVQYVKHNGRGWTGTCRSQQRRVYTGAASGVCRARQEQACQS